MGDRAVGKTSIIQALVENKKQNLTTRTQVITDVKKIVPIEHNGKKYSV